MARRADHVPARRTTRGGACPIPGTVGFKVADELGYHDGLTTRAQVLAFLGATRAALTRVAPQAQVLVDAVVPELGCLPGHDAGGAECAREVRATSPGATVDTVSSYLSAGLVDRLDLRAGCCRHRPTATAG